MPCGDLLSFYFLRTTNDPRRAVALQQSRMESAQTCLTVTACHRGCQEDTKSSLTYGVTNTRSRIVCLYCDEKPAYSVPSTVCGGVVRQSPDVVRGLNSRRSRNCYMKNEAPLSAYAVLSVDISSCNMHKRKSQCNVAKRT